MSFFPLNNNTIKTFKRPKRRFYFITAARRGPSKIKVGRVHTLTLIQSTQMSSIMSLVP